MVKVFHYSTVPNTIAIFAQKIPPQDIYLSILVVVVMYDNLIRRLPKSKTMSILYTADYLDPRLIWHCRLPLQFIRTFFKSAHIFHLHTFTCILNVQTVDLHPHGSV